ncbi:MAG TPA: VOC family protein [Mycobacterium sp.]|nr:VOC family protein [Mycobacterium sp.]
MTRRGKCSVVQIWELRARFATALSAMYGAEVPAYNTLVTTTATVNADYVRTHPQAERLGALDRVTSERHGAIRVGTPAELAAVADLFAAFGMYPVGYYDLRAAASPVPVVSTAFRPIDPDELARNPFRVFTSLLATADGRFFDDDLRPRVQRFLTARTLFDPALITLARTIAADGGCATDTAVDFVTRAVSAFALSPAPIDRGWYEELSAVSAVAADIAGVATTHINHLTPRVLDIDDLYARMNAQGIAMIDAIQGPPRTDGAAVLLRQTSFRALAEPRRFQEADGTVTEGSVRVRFGEVEARGVALTPAGRQRYDCALAAAAGAPLTAELWQQYFPVTDAELAGEQLAYYRGGDPAKPVVYEDFLPASAAGIFRSNLDGDGPPAAGTPDCPPSDYSPDWLAGALDRDMYDPYDLYEKAAT